MTADSSSTLSVASLSRRSFLVQSALASCGFTFVMAGCTGSSAERQPGPPGADKQASLSTSSWVTLHGDGTIEIVSPGIELGQGTMTALALFVAEELDADWKFVRVIAAPADEKRFGNPLFWNLQITGGSRTLLGYFDVLRLAGAQARHVLLTAAAANWGVNLRELTTDSSVVSHLKSSRRATYGELVASARVPSKFPEFLAPDFHPQRADDYFGEAPPSPVAPGPDKVGALLLKSPDRYKLLGVDKPRVDIPLKVNGTAQYGIDVQIPDMLYAMVETGPVGGAVPESIDAAAARAVPGVVDILPIPHGVAIIGTTIFAVRDARGKLKVSWQSDTQAPQYESDKALEDLYQTAVRGKSGDQVFLQGDAHKIEAALSGAKTAGVRRVTFDALSELVYHAPLEPQNATIRIAPDGLSAEIWVGTQSPKLEADLAAPILGIKSKNIRVNMLFTGGAFGRRAEPGAVLDAAHIARHVRRPVKVIWTREDDIKRNPHRQALVCRIEAAVTDSGAILAMRHRIVGDSWLARVYPELFQQFNNTDPGNWIGARHAYDVPDQVAENWSPRLPLDVCYLRGVGVTQVKFAQECLIDQIAREVGQDPLQLRLTLLKAEPRGAAVLHEVARLSKWDQWDKKRTDRALGLSYMSYANAHGSLVTEVSVDRKSGAVKVHKVWAVIDAGLAVQPGSIVAQIEGGVTQGMSIALHERITVKKGVVQESNFHEYPILRMSEVPEIEVKVLSTDYEISGASEIGLSQIAPAINNALARLIGKHLTRVPMLPQDVLQALKT